MKRIKDYVTILKIKAGDTDAWEILVERYYNTIFNYCKRRFFGNVRLAEDLTQDVFLKVIANIHQYKFSGSFFNFLFTITVNTCHNYASKKKFNESELNEAVGYKEIRTIKNPAIESETTDEIQQALNTLPDNQREAIILKFFYDMKVREIAKFTGTSVPTAQSRINQGLKKMKKIVNKEDLYFD